MSAERRLGRVYKLAPDSKSLALDETIEAAIDEKAMSATVVMSTPSPDRVKDIMLPGGCRLDQYTALYAPVFWDHGFDFTLPIATSIDRTKNEVAVYPKESGVQATGFFTDKLKESEQIFVLMAERMIAAASPRFMALKESFKGVGGERYRVIDEWMLEEWSIVGLPCNPEALLGVISKGRLAGTGISESILKSLRAIAPEKTVQVPGVTLEKTVAETTTKAAETTTETTVVEEAPAIPRGAEVLSAFYVGMKTLIANTESALECCESEPVKDFFANTIPVLQTELTNSEAAYGAHYESCPPLKVEVNESEQEQELKAWLAQGNHKWRAVAIVSDLKKLADTKGVPAQVRSALTAQADKLNKICTEAKGTVASKQEQLLEAMAAKLTALTKRLEDSVPYRRVHATAP